MAIPIYTVLPYCVMYSNALLTTINDTCIMCDTVECVCIRRLSCIMYHEVYMMAGKTDCESCSCETTTPIITGVIIGVIGVIVGVVGGGSGLIITFKKQR